MHGFGALRRQITFRMKDGFSEYLNATHGSDSSLPKDVKELEEKAGIKLVVTDKKDPEDVGFVQWRVAFYVAAIDLKNFMFLLDGWFVYKERHRD